MKSEGENLRSNSKVVLLMFILLIFLTGCNQNSKLLRDEKIGSPTGFSYFINLTLFISNPPALGEDAKITAVITNNFAKRKDYSYEAIADIILPEGLELIEGNTTWKGLLDDESTFNVLVRPIKTGNYTIEGMVRSPPSGDGFVFSRDFIYLSVFGDHSITRDTPFPKQLCQDRYIDGELIRCTTATQIQK